MKIFVDEHIPLMTVWTLRRLGHDVRDIRGTPDEGMQDDALSSSSSGLAFGVGLSSMLMEEQKGENTP